MSPKPEEEARQVIDELLTSCGWVVQDYKDIHITAAQGVAVREFPLETGFVDYLLYADGKAIGTVEAKPKGYSLTSVEQQSKKYSEGLPANLPHYFLPLPFAYESTGAETRFTNLLDPEPRSREVFAFHRPEELLRLAEVGDDQLRAKLKAMPALDRSRLWDVQVDSIQNLEQSLAAARPKALIQMATGTGKTYTAVSSCYRLIKFGGAKRILFLVDRNNLGKQTFTEFDQFQSPYSAYKFTEEFPVQRLRKNTIAQSSKVCITTIQRLYSMLQGNDDYAEENEEGSMFESSAALPSEPAPVEYNPAIPIEMFDFIVVDECHRSIYNLWRQVLEYFDAFLIGLTATPSAQTIGFFDGNLVQDYGHESAVLDGINVGYDIYRIQTEVSSQGATLKKEPGLMVPRRDRRTREKRCAALDQDVAYQARQLDRDVVNKSQIRLVIETFRDRLFTEIFPGRKEVPKTLIFAKTDLHADDIVDIVRVVFGKGNDFCQKITSKTTGAKPEDLLQLFRTSYNPRIVVTVDMIATGTDVKPLECLVFMRNIRSLGYFEQMKGRGCRIIDVDTLRQVTPDAGLKDRFVVVDAVGICMDDLQTTKPIDRKPTVPLDKLVKAAGAGAADADLASALASRLARLSRRLDGDDEARLTKAAGGRDLTQISESLLGSIDADQTHEAARKEFELADDADPTDEQLDGVEREAVREAMRPFLDPAFRNALLEIHSSLEQVIDEVTQDRLVGAAYDAEALDKAKALTGDFRKFCEEHKDEIEALRILYSRPYRAGLRFHHLKELEKALRRPPLSASAKRLWAAFEAVEPDRVKGHGGSQVVDVVNLVRHAITPESDLEPFAQTVDQRYRQWLTEREVEGVALTDEQRRWLDAIKDHIASSLSIGMDDFDFPPLSQLGGRGKVYELFGDGLDDVLRQLNEVLAA